MVVNVVVRTRCRAAWGAHVPVGHPRVPHCDCDPPAGWALTSVWHDANLEEEATACSDILNWCGYRGRGTPPQAVIQPLRKRPPVRPQSYRNTVKLTYYITDHSNEIDIHPRTAYAILKCLKEAQNAPTIQNHAREIRAQDGISCHLFVFAHTHDVVCSIYSINNENIFEFQRII
eukprot:1089918-Prorocentrum_minimum.AAC.3